MNPRNIRVALYTGLGIFIISFGGMLVLIALWQTLRAAFTPAWSVSATSTSERPGRADGFVYSFNTPGVLHEARDRNKSSSPYWVLASGGMFIVGEGIGGTIQGSLPEGDRWRTAYRDSSPVDSDDGAHPQNLFRLTTKEDWVSAREEVWFRVVNDNLSASENRNASNGLFLMSRYQDEDTLYYAGIRVDGTAVIKKKYHGVYYTVAQAPFTGGTYHRTTTPTLLPHNEWVGLRADTITNPDGSVSVNLYLKRERGSAWALLLAARDDGSFGDTLPITARGAYGIRTDFMDVQFRDFKLERL